jgi:hypothetical protein
MALLPNHVLAQIEFAKLHAYCLSANHPRGRHKARQFAASLGISAGDANWLRDQILQGIAETDAVRQEADEYGQRWRVDLLLTRQNRRVVVRTIWMVRQRENFPRFITCWVL